MIIDQVSFTCADMKFSVDRLKQMPCKLSSSTRPREEPAKRPCEEPEGRSHEEPLVCPREDRAQDAPLLVARLAGPATPGPYRSAELKEETSRVPLLKAPKIMEIQLSPKAATMTDQGEVQCHPRSL